MPTAAARMARPAEPASPLVERLTVIVGAAAAKAGPESDKPSARDCVSRHGMSPIACCWRRRDRLRTAQARTRGACPVGYDLASYMATLLLREPGERAPIPAFVFFLFCIPRRGEPAWRAAACLCGVKRWRARAALRASALSRSRMARRPRYLRHGRPCPARSARGTRGFRPYGTFAEMARMIRPPHSTSGAIRSGWWRRPRRAAVPVRGAGGIGFGSVLYAPTLRFYCVSPLWAPVLTVARLFCVAPRCISPPGPDAAGGKWKGRTWG